MDRDASGSQEHTKGQFTQNASLHIKREMPHSRMVLKSASQKASSAMLASNKTVDMPTCYCIQKLTILAPATESSDWSTFFRTDID